MTTTNKSVLIAGFTVFVMVGFQNCSKAQFSSSGSQNLAKSAASDTSSEGTQGTNVAATPIDDDRDCKKEDRNDTRPKSDDDYVACVLSGPGKSVKLGIIESGANGVHSVAQSVCVTRRACLTEVAQHFEVEGAYDRGYCEGNRHVLHLSDSEVKDLCRKKH